MAETPPQEPSSAKNILLPNYRGRREQAKHFKEADKQRSKSGTLLLPDEIASGQVDFSRKLQTMLGGMPRPLTEQDLIQFKRIAESQRLKFKKGITAKSVVDLALPIAPQTAAGPNDKSRANTEIHMAVPVSNHGGQVRFMTNAGPDSDRQRHYVTVDFINYEAIAASAIDISKVSREMSKSPLKIACDCGRWRFWLAYLATIGGYNAGHPETAFPKIRNPELAGVGCKHILRVMQSILKSASISQYMRKMVEKGRITTERKLQAVRITEQRKLANAATKETSKSKLVQSKEDRAVARQAAKLRSMATKPSPALGKVAKKTSASKDKRSFIKTLVDLNVTRELAETAWLAWQKSLGGEK